VWNKIIILRTIICDTISQILDVTIVTVSVISVRKIKKFINDYFIFLICLIK